MTLVHTVPHRVTTNWAVNGYVLQHLIQANAAAGRSTAADHQLEAVREKYWVW